MAANIRFTELDGLRGLAALWVVVFHLVGRPYGYWLKDNPTLAASLSPADINLYGGYAVHLFFIISGFVIFMTIHRSTTVLDFAVSRAARLYPAFWVSVLVAAFIGVIFPSPAQPINAWQVIVNLSMLHRFFSVDPVEPVYWSLAYEIGFYLLVALIFASGALRRIELFGCIWVFLSFAFLKLMPVIGENIPWRLQTAVALPYASLFFAGIVYYKIWSEGISPGRVTFVVLCYLEHIINHDLISIAILTTIFAVFSLCVLGYGSWLASRPLVFLGTISYSLYLIHGALGYRIQLLNHAFGLPPFVNLCVATSVTICAATVITFFIERPANRALRTAYRRITPPKPIGKLRPKQTV